MRDIDVPHPTDAIKAAAARQAAQREAARKVSQEIAAQRDAQASQDAAVRAQQAGQ